MFSNTLICYLSWLWQYPMELSLVFRCFGPHGAGGRCRRWCLLTSCSWFHVYCQVGSCRDAARGTATGASCLEGTLQSSRTCCSHLEILHNSYTRPDKLRSHIQLTWWVFWQTSSRCLARNMARNSVWILSVSPVEGACLPESDKRWTSKWWRGAGHWQLGTDSYLL